MPARYYPFHAVLFLARLVPVSFFPLPWGAALVRIHFQLPSFVPPGLYRKIFFWACAFGVESACGFA